ncbi:hypothetical protein BU26DRAFT_561608 [Trematosphaeria pertusa]|uniref:Carbohydrate-binding module family 18 protein n=1 Tax=Trematosphaeria pertusa TaxID=390896 RepID=A0A6A6IQL2_9PLEO|nr:uncharacterized protein BU26DRAFT_561608 [Trematosphaeria pertusa]KAF2251803.1 hypothetical protein BU26DRAFT_561608 [Trematosphaeria pertusa]
MKFPSSIILALLPLVLANPIAEAPASADGPAAIPFGQVDGLMRRESCSVTGKGGLNGSGTCKNTNYWDCNYVSVPGFCPGPSDYQCCRNIACSGKYSGWTCRNTYKGCGSGSKFVTGYCPGDETIKCCVPS